MATWILGVSALYHDAAAVLVRDGVVVAAAQEERFSRVKHDPSMPVRAAAWCMEHAGITASDLDHVVFYEKPLKKFERVLASAVGHFPRAALQFARAMQGWLTDKLWMRNKLTAAFGVPADRVLFCEHHLSHAASALFWSPHRRAAVLTVDGVGEHATTSLYRGLDEPPFLEPVAQIEYPHSLGFFYSAFTAYLGFAVNSGEYKVMGMAPLGEPRFRDEMDRILRLDEDGGFSLDMDWFSFEWHPTQAITDRFEQAFGPARHPGAPFDVGPDAPEEIRRESQRFADIAASAQLALEDAMLHLAREAHARVGGDALCLAGGVALNAVANGRIARDGPFEHVWVQPAAGDAGGAMGAALWAWHVVLGNPRDDLVQRPDLGKAWSDQDIGELLEDVGLPHEHLGSAEAAADHAAERLAQGDVVGWFQGRFEWGPRALGHRSILADPRGADTRDRVNGKVKFREAFRPFAPAVADEDADAWFDFPSPARGPARFMVTTVQVADGAGERIPATTHVNGSARVQLVSAEGAPLFHRLIRAFGEHTGVPLVLNTSFNLRGEPMVSSPVDAVATFMRCGLDRLYMGPYVVGRPTRDLHASDEERGGA